MVLLFLAEDCILILYYLLKIEGFTGGDLSHATGLGSLFCGETHSFFFFHFKIQDVCLLILNVTLQLPMFNSFESCVVSLKSVVFCVCI